MPAVSRLPTISFDGGGHFDGRFANTD